MHPSSDQFYTALPVHKMRLTDLLLARELFVKVPADWYVIITDIRGSTPAVQRGLHQDINLVATGSIVSLLNLAFNENISVPFFFGGDGATFIVPPRILNKVLPVLLLFQERTNKDFGLDLRVGQLAVSEIYEKGHALSISKFCFSERFPIPVIGGMGLQYAESVIKANEYRLSGHLIQEEELNLLGMQCRWDRIPPPDNKEEVVTLLVVTRDAELQNIIFSRVLKVIDDIYGAADKRHPVSIAKLKLKTTFNRLGKEMRVRIGRIRSLEIIYLWLLTLLGPLYFKTRKGKKYLNDLVTMSDTLVLDGRINTVISGTGRQRVALIAALDALEQEGRIYYGLHVSNAVIMSCYVRDMKDGHIHFVDGAEGGYTYAARMLKAKIQATV